MKGKIDELAGLMQEFNLDRAKLKGEDWAVEFALDHPETRQNVVIGAPVAEASAPAKREKPVAPVPQAPKGTAVTSPMTGIYYTSSNPGAPPFCKVGDPVTAGQVVGLIEAMKVFNEITAPVSGTILDVPAKNAQLVQPGDTLVTIG